MTPDPLDELARAEVAAMVVRAVVVVAALAGLWADGPDTAEPNAVDLEDVCEDRR